MEKIHNLKKRNGSKLKSSIIFGLGVILGSLWALPLFAQAPEINVRFANPDYDCANSVYCLDVEFKSDIPEQELFGMNVRFFYDGSVLNLLDFRGFQGGYAAVNPNPPIVNTGASNSGSGLFSFEGTAVFINGAIQLINNNAPPIKISTTGWTKIFQICFEVVDPNVNQTNFCPSVIWDLEEDPRLGGFITGDDGVVFTVVAQVENEGSSPVNEKVEPFNWQYDGISGLPHGSPLQNSCTSLLCGEIVQLQVGNIDEVISCEPGKTGVSDYIEYLIIVRNTGDFKVEQITLIASNVDPESISCSSFSLDPGEEKVCTARHTITQADIDEGVVLNRVIAKGEDPFGNSVTDESDDPDVSVNVDPDNDGEPDDLTITPLEQHPRIGLIKSPNTKTFFAVGDEISYIFILQNAGNVSLEDINIEDPDADPGSISCSQEILAPGEFMICTATQTVTQSDMDAGVVINTAVANAKDKQGNVINTMTNELKVFSGICTISVECIDYTFAGRFDFGDGRTQLCFDVQVNCDQDLRFITFDVDSQVSFPGNGSKVQGSSGTQYQIERPANTPYQGGLKYETIGEGVKDGASEQLCYIVPTEIAQQMNTLRIMGEAESKSYEANLDLRNCIRVGE